MMPEKNPCLPREEFGLPRRAIRASDLPEGQERLDRDGINGTESLHLNVEGGIKPPSRVAQPRLSKVHPAKVTKADRLRQPGVGRPGERLRLREQE